MGTMDQGYFKWCCSIAYFCKQYWKVQPLQIFGRGGKVFLSYRWQWRLAVEIDLFFNLALLLTWRWLFMCSSRCADLGIWKPPPSSLFQHAMVGYHTSLSLSGEEEKVCVANSSGFVLASVFPWQQVDQATWRVLANKPGCSCLVGCRSLRRQVGAMTWTGLADGINLPDVLMFYGQKFVWTKLVISWKDVCTN